MGRFGSSIFILAPAVLPPVVVLVSVFAWREGNPVCLQAIDSCLYAMAIAGMHSDPNIILYPILLVEYGLMHVINHSACDRISSSIRTVGVY